MFVPLTPLRCLHRAIDVFGSKTGIVSGDHSFTYAQFGERCEKLATGLPQFGIGAGDRVAYLSFNTHQLIEGYYGVVQARGIVMPLNVRLSEVELTNILCHSGAKMLLFENDFAPMVQKLRKSCPNVKKWVGLDGTDHGADLSYEEILDAGHPERADIFTYDEMAIAELFYTSGSTGTPKGVTLAHRTLYLHALDVAAIFKDIESMVDLHTIPMFHANGWGRPQGSTNMGVPQVMVRRFEPTFVFELIQKYKATDMCLVPTMANAMICAPDRNKWDTSSMRRIMIGGAAASPELVERVETAFPTAECIAGYGLTETAPVLTSSRHKVASYPSNEERLRRQSSAGWPVPGVTVRVVDPEMRDVPRDMQSIGEVVAMGDHIMEGYYNEPEATAAVMSGPWFHTGDMAIWDEDTYLHIVDRKKEIIISGGENISSIEVERAIFSHPAVFECAVVAAPSDKWGEVPAAIVVLKPGETLTSDELMTFLEQRLGKFKLPRIIDFSTEPLPKTGTGKIRKLILKEKFWAGKEKRVQG
ncbi:MAG TPA: long-chain-fatty-acid--CoA ligase [Bryobacteraceae bacterium]|jgi:fatty-acyl-CoA synthase|nr:long-chain-fatty-acid--CoA ligase [Bryobacteraceae bacterium]